MRLTLRVENDNYLDVEIIPQKNLIVIHSPIPEIDEETFMDIAKMGNYNIYLPITDTLYKVTNSRDEELTTKMALTVMSVLTHFIVTDK